MVSEGRGREEGRDDRGKRGERKGGYGVDGSKEQENIDWRKEKGTRGGRGR
jgi:hypothetical protein